MKKESVYCFNIFYAFSFYAPLVKSGGASAPRPPVFDAPDILVVYVGAMGVIQKTLLRNKSTKAISPQK